MAFIPIKNFLSIRHFKLIGLIGPRAVGERVKRHTGTLGCYVPTLILLNFNFVPII
jgi:hypothetical protein